MAAGVNSDRIRDGQYAKAKAEQVLKKKSLIFAEGSLDDKGESDPTCSIDSISLNLGKKVGGVEYSGDTIAISKGVAFYENEAEVSVVSSVEETLRSDRVEDRSETKWKRL
ncbi:hypothetical protein ACOSQ3_025236 [Xanthoceras sorbifolium]